MKCRLTGTEGKAVDAHVVPRAFYEIDPDAEGPHRVVSNVEGEHPRRAPIGIYDSTILTEEGERCLSSWDSYGAEVLLKQRDLLVPMRNAGKIVAWQRDCYDYRLLKLFALSVLWRAGVSSHPFFQKIQLGPHENMIRELLLENDPGDPEQYSVILSSWTDQERGPGIMDPFRERYDMVNFYRSYLGNYICYVKVDQRKTPETLSKVQLQPDAPLIVIGRELAASKELLIMKNIIRRHVR